MRKKQKREDNRGKANTKCAKILTSGVCVKTRQGENIVVREGNGFQTVLVTIATPTPLTNLPTTLKLFNPIYNIP